MALVKLIHTDAEATGGPLTADVPESAVHIWLECGWRRAPEEESAPAPEAEAAPVQEESAPVQEAESAPAQAPETRKRGRKKAAAPAA